MRVRAFLFSGNVQKSFPMPRESTVTKFDRTQKILSALKCVYPDAHCELNFETPLQLLVATILSAQCTDKRVNIVTCLLYTSPSPRDS